MSLVRRVGILDDLAQTMFKDNFWSDNPDIYGLKQYRDGDTLSVYIELPGVSKDNLSLETKDNMLRVKATKKYGNYSSEIERVFSIDLRVDMSSVEAELKDGILKLQFQPNKEDKAQIIKVK